jgi:hypothetical protein
MKALFLILLFVSCKEEQKNEVMIGLERCILSCVSNHLNGFDEIDGNVVDKFTTLCTLEFKDRACCLEPTYQYAKACDKRY